MTCVFQARQLTKRFQGRAVLDRVDLQLEGPGITGLLGRNGCGKTTLIRHMSGQYLPSDGHAETLGKAGAKLGHDELGRFGLVPQEVRLLEWMTVEQHLEFVSSFYSNWDTDRQEQLLEQLELERGQMVGILSAGNLQKLAILLAVCHHPQFLVLDEPVSDLDPISRSRLLAFLLQVLREDEATILVSSHVLRDVERVVDRVVCLDEGRIRTDAALDDLKESLQLWLVQAPGRELPSKFAEPFILDQEVDGRQARLVVNAPAGAVDDFRSAHDVEVSPQSMNLEEMFPWLVRGGLQ